MGRAKSRQKFPETHARASPRLQGRLSRAAAVTPSGRDGKCRRLSVKGRRLSRFPLVVTGGHPRARRPRSADDPAGHFLFPSPGFLPAGARALGDPAGGSARKGGAGRSAALGCDPERFHFWIPPRAFWESTWVGVQGDPGAGRGPAPGTPSERWAFSPGGHAPHAPSHFPPPPPVGSTPPSPEPPLLPAATAPAGAADPRRGPERRGRQEERAVKPQAGG